MTFGKELTTRVITAAVYVAVMLVFIIPGHWVPMIPLILMFVVAFLSAFEKAQAIRLRQPEVRPLYVAIFSVVLGLLALLGVLKETLLRGLSDSIDPTVNTVVAPRIFGYYALLSLFILPIAGLFRMWKKGSELLPDSLWESYIVLSSSIPLASTIALFYGIRFGWQWFVLAILTSWISDSFSYFAGRLFGRLRFSPVLSPNKTWEGTIGGVVGTILLYLLYFPLVIGKAAGYASGASIAFSIVAAVIMSLSATFGDLINSAIKRWCKIKDFGSLLPGHGGISDRFDSIFTTLPAILLLAIFASVIL